MIITRGIIKITFEFVEGSLEAKQQEELSESEKGIRDWLRKNKKMSYCCC